MNKNPLYERFIKISEYCEKLEEANYDCYKLFEPVSAEKIKKWENEHNAKLPEGYKNWLLLSNGFEMSNTANFLPLEGVGSREKCCLPLEEVENEENYYCIGYYIGDGSELLTDSNGIFYELDHGFGLKRTSFNCFLDDWIIEHLEDSMQETGLL